MRQKLETPEFEIQIIGFAKQIGDIADGAKSVVAVLPARVRADRRCRSTSTRRSWVLTVLPLACSLASVVWQFGTLQLLGYGLDPLAVLVPFLVFAIGVSHGVQQINYISKEIRTGVDTMTAARRSFTGLLIPGTMALVTAFVGFATLTLIPIPMIRELGITASIGVAYKIVTNLVMLPLAVSYFRFDDALRGARERGARAACGRSWAGCCAASSRATPRSARWPAPRCSPSPSSRARAATSATCSPARRSCAPTRATTATRARSSSKFDLGLDVLSVVVETPKDGCYDHATMEYVNQFGWQMANVPGRAVGRLGAAAREAGVLRLQRGQPEVGGAAARSQVAGQRDQPGARGLRALEPRLHGAARPPLPRRPQGDDDQGGDRRGQGIPRGATRSSGSTIRLASGNVGVQAATNEVLETTELPMMLYVYLTIVALVFLTYRDWRAMLACCLPLTRRDVPRLLVHEGAGHRAHGGHAAGDGAGGGHRRRLRVLHLQPAADLPRRRASTSSPRSSRRCARPGSRRSSPR